jgi:hypothetical protein
VVTVPASCEIGAVINLLLVECCDMVFNGCSNDSLRSRPKGLSLFYDKIARVRAVLRFQYRKHCQFLCFHLTLKPMAAQSLDKSMGKGAG